MTGSRLRKCEIPHLICLAVQSLCDGLRMGLAEIVALFSGKYTRPIARGIWLVFSLPLILGWQGVNWICFILDEIFFSRYRQTSIVSPVFVLGPPRSGTTHLHRLLAESAEDYATASAWELLLAPSIVQKKGIRGLMKLDRRIGRPLYKSFIFLEGFLLKQFSDTHPGSLKDPEEDYFYLQPLLRCSGWMLAFPAWTGFRRLLPGCAEMSDSHRREALCFYRRSLKKQLFVHGENKTLLSKNASFSSWIDLLPDFFPDARYVVCMRSPLETVPSMLSTADLAAKGFFAESVTRETHTVLLDCMRAHYQVLYTQVPTIASHQMVVVSHHELKRNVEALFALFQDQLGLRISDEFLAELPAKAEKSRAFVSRHRYQFEDYDLSEAELLGTFPQTSSTLKRGVA
ncbi:sulfotransferase [Kiritimatiellaeota bacterium B1221]|nr:sulfotransferase [Kiritimatiellaeota bacterium B1221]